MSVNFYCGQALTPRNIKHELKKAVRILRPVEFDAIAIRGASGLLFGPLIAYMLGKPLILVRKGTELSDGHSRNMPVEYPIDKGTYIIVDDLISSGATVRTIIEAIKDKAPALTPIGVYTWNSNYESSGGTVIENLKLKRLNGDM